MASRNIHGVFADMAAPTRFSPSLVVPRAVTRGLRHHFFGYYDKSPWDATGRWMLGLEATFMDRPPTEKDQVTVGLIDTANGNEWTALAETSAWNWQQGCMLQWLNGGREDEIIFNVRSDDGLGARILNVKTGRSRTLDRPVYAVNATGTHAISLNFARLHHQRPGYGYAGITDPWRHEAAPYDDGLYALNLTTGDSRLILSVAAAERLEQRADFAKKTHRFNHVQFSTNEQRFACLHRAKSPEQEVGDTRLLTLNLDGSKLNCLSDYGVVSHYDWRGEEAILAWSRRAGIGDRYFLFPDDGGPVQTIGEGVLTTDGHCSFSPDGRWVLTDTYPDATQHRTLLLYRWNTGERIDIGRFHAPPMEWQIRCDLHPRWSRDGRQVCIDSIHEGTRQMYVIDVSDITGG